MATEIDLEQLRARMRGRADLIEMTRIELAALELAQNRDGWCNSAFTIPWERHKPEYARDVLACGWPPEYQALVLEVCAERAPWLVEPLKAGFEAARKAREHR